MDTSTASTAAAGMWLIVVGVVLLLGTRRIRAAQYATSRRDAHRTALRTNIAINGIEGELLDISVGGEAVRIPVGSLPHTGLVEFKLPRSQAIKMSMVRVPQQVDDYEVASLQVVSGDWAAYQAMSLWLFHTPPGAVPGLEAGVPAIAATNSG
jgi:cellulose synthase (UDP-forming)